MSPSLLSLEMPGSGDVQTQTVGAGDQRGGAASPPPSQAAPSEGGGDEQTHWTGGKTAQPSTPITSCDVNIENVDASNHSLNPSVMSVCVL